MDAPSTSQQRVEGGLRELRAPALPAAAGIFIGAWWAFHQVRPPWEGLLLPLVLLALGLAWGRKRGAFVTALALGAATALCHGALDGDLEARGFEPSRPVVADVRPVGSWREDELGWSVAVAIRSLSQGSGESLRLYPPPSRVRLRLPPSASRPPAGRLRLRGYLRRGTALHNDPPQAPGPWRLWVKSNDLLTPLAPPSSVERLSRTLRTRVAKALDDAGDGLGTAFCRALVLGDASRLPDDLVRALRRLGVGHVLAVSGLHVAAVAALALLVLSWVPHRIRLPLALLPVAGYVLLVGPRPSLLRAAVMALAAVLALSSKRPPVAANALGCFVIGSLLLAPPLVLDVGFQLTVAATGGLVLLAPGLERRWRRLPALLARPAAATVAAQIATLPFALPVFHLWVPAAPIYNLLIVPWAGLVLTSCLLWTVLALATPSLAAGLAPWLDTLCAPVSWLRQVPPGPWAAWPTIAGPGVALLLAGLLAAAAWWPRRIGSWVLVAVLATSLRPGGEVPDPRLTMLDVGQGDSFLLEDGGHAVLVDGGGWFGGGIGERVLLPALTGLGVRRLDAVVMTHSDRDHCGGLVEILDFLPVGELWSDPGWWADGCGQALESRLPAVPLAARDVQRVGRWRLEVLATGRGSRDNDRSLVLRAWVGERCVLLTGDIEAEAERRLLELPVARSPFGLHCEVLKVAHHGSKTSTTPAFLAAVEPRRALVSAGRGNRYGHPARSVVDRLDRARVQVLRSDQDGQVRLRFRSDGGLWIETLASRPASPAAPDG
ncbi:MAG: DNA internalization-related competence protein ComEC/Rec2 [Acidobacteria bacterium]|nr:DNA internalization-related competence protein ComEC/Rec2 [Acidobacteriota bacterium]